MTILAAVGEEQQASAVVEVGYDVATAHGEELVVMHVVPEKDFETHQASIMELPGFDEYSITQEEESAARFAQRVVDETLDEYESDAVRTVGRVGNPEKEILAAVEDLDARYLVIGARRRSPAGKALFGSTTQTILLESDVPVMTVMLQ
jgi:nucleotide-binding universal stress UspA family protein